MEKELIDSLWEKYKEKIVELRRRLHRYPERAFQEERTAAAVEEVLKACQPIEIKRVAGTGVTALLNGGAQGSGRTLALRADMDALPLSEKTGLPYASERPGLMHACGHDAHVAMLAGAALILADMRESWSGRVRLIFQPAEEEIGGAQPMIEAGILNSPPVEAIMALHLWPDLPLGQVGLRDGALMASNDRFRIWVQGQATHGATPEKGVDALLVGAQIAISLQHLISRETPALDTAVISLGVFRAGTTYNIVSGEAELEGSLRTLDPTLRAKLKKRIKEMVEGIAGAYGARAEVDYLSGFPVTVNAPDFNRVVARAAAQILGPESIVWLENAAMVSEDFSHFLERVPGAMVFLGCGNLVGKTYPLHHECFQFNEEVLEYGTKLLVATVGEYLPAASSHKVFL